MYISGIDYESFNNGLGIRTVIYVSGCLHNCVGCHNPETHNFKNGRLLTKELILEIKENIQERKFISGLTISGGDSMFSSEDTINLINLIGKDIYKNLWLYTGFTFENLVNDKNKSKEDELRYKLLTMVDILVDGKFEIEYKNISLKFRGSTNQRLIDVQKSLQEGKVILWE